MSRPLIRSLRATVGTIVLTMTGVVGRVAAQQPGTWVSPFDKAVGAMIVTAVLGGGLIRFAPAFSDHATQQVHAKPKATFLYGVAVALGVTIAIVILAVTLVGLILAIPLAVLSLLLGQLGYLAVGRLFSDNWFVVLLVAMGVSAVVVSVPVFGVGIAFVLGSFGLGTTFLFYREDEESPSDPSENEG